MTPVSVRTPKPAASAVKPQTPAPPPLPDNRKEMIREMIRDVKQEGRKFIFDDNGDLACVLFSAEAYDDLMERLDDAELIAIAMHRMAHYDPDKLLSMEQVNEMLGLTEEDLADFEDVEIE